MLVVLIRHSFGNEFFCHHRSHRKQKINSGAGITATVELTHTLVVLCNTTPCSVASPNHLCKSGHWPSLAAQKVALLRAILSHCVL